MTTKLESVPRFAEICYKSFNVPADVVVAQSRENMAVWYNMDAPERVTLLPIKGDIVDITRDDGKTEVVVQEGQHQLSYELDEGLIEFGTAVDDGDFDRAVTFLVILFLSVFDYFFCLYVSFHFVW